MIIGHELNENEKNKLRNFKKKYYQLYPDYLQEEMDNKLELGFTNNNDLVNSIYCYLNIDDELNPYKAYIKYLSNKFDMNSKILEVGSGTIPMLAKYINSYNLVTLEKDPIECFYENINLIKDSFSLDTDISNYELIIGYNPCGATENIIRSAIRNNKNFSIALCGCCFLPENYKVRTKEEWHKYLFKIAEIESNNNYDIYCDYFDDNLKLDNPIITGIKK